MAPETLATLHDSPRSTIIPPAAHTTAGGRALEILTQLSRGSGLGQLETGDVIGEGGMGVIRAATQVALGRGVAVKTLKPNRRDATASLDLLREAWVTGSIEHPNVVPVHYLEVDPDGVPVIVMKRIAGVEWSKLLGDAAEVERRFGAKDLLAWNLGILMSVLNALRYAHSRGVVHRDVKPSNVMIGDFGEVYLLDWGIAVSLVDDGSGRLPLAVNATQLAGTPHYMAPEMLGAADGRPITEQTDVYLAGSVLFELVAGRPPHEGKTAGAIIASVIASSPTLPGSAAPELARICLRAMHEQPAERFPSVDALRLAIQGYLEHRGSADLAARAAVRLDELRVVLATPGADTEERHEVIYRLFGGCRFGFHEALAVWPDNADARAGLAAATAAVAEYELAAGNPKGAVTLLGELTEPPAELLARARAAVEAAARHQAELEKLRAEHDRTLGRRTRTFFSVILGLTFGVLPLVNEWWPSLHAAESHGRDTLIALGAFIILVGLAYWARNTLRATAFNRKISATGLFVFAAQMILSQGASALGISVAEAQVFMIFLWGVITTMLTIAVDLWLWPSAVVYIASFLLSAHSPELRFYAMAVGNFSFAINALFRWAPATLRPTDEERAARDARDADARARARRPRSS
ncbi:MAG: serine/threonine protein kinase [Myxococcales bacterium]|nr:serine/threonine protein kinase [Myxococcales bacterium]